jgi:photosystem II stability/assembly factor-like uncharacterized protein
MSPPRVAVLVLLLSSTLPALSGAPSPGVGGPRASGFFPAHEQTRGTAAEKKGWYVELRGAELPYNALSCLAKTCFAVGATSAGPVVAKSRGSKWVEDHLPSGVGTLEAVSCLPGSSDCWSAGYEGAKGDIYRTSDAGSKWTIENLPSSPISGMSCGSSSDCWATVNGSIYASTDGGTSWAEQTGDLGVARIVCTNHLDCWAVGSNGGSGVVFASGNGGATWSEQTLPTGTSPLYALSCVNASDCWADGDSVIVGTSDGGGSWTTELADTTSDLNLRSIWCPSAGRCFASGYLETGTTITAIVYATKDGGDTWATQELPKAAQSSYMLYAVACRNGLDCFGLDNGTDGVILATTDGGGAS